MYIEQLYKKIGIRKLHDFVAPKVMKLEEFNFPKNSTLVSFLEKHTFPLSTNLIFKNAGKPKMYTADEYRRPIYDVKRNSVKISSLVLRHKNEDSGFEYVYDINKILLTPSNKLTIFNYNALDLLYRYPSRKGETFKRVLNRFKTVKECLNNGISRDRVRYIHVPVDINIPDLKTLKRYVNASEKVKEEKFPTDFSLFITEIYKLLHPELNKDSVFADIHLEEVPNIYFIFTYGNSMVLLSLQHLLSSVKEYKMLVMKSSTSGKTVFKLFLLMIIRLIKSEPKSLDVLEKDGEVASGIDVVTKTETGDFKIEDKEIENILDQEIIDTVEQTDKGDDLLEAIIEKETINRKILQLDEKEDENVEDIAERNLRDQLESGEITEKVFEEQLKIIKESNFKPKKTDMTKLEISKEEAKVKDTKTVFDKSMLEDTISQFDKKYIENQLENDIDNMVYSLSNASIAVVGHNKIEEDSVMGKMVTHEIEIKVPAGRKNKIKIHMPKVEEDGTFKLSGNTYIMRKQKMDKPIRKIDTNVVSLSSFYGKLFITKHQYKANDKGYAIYKQLHKRSMEENPDIKMLIHTENKITDVELPTDYTLVGRYIRSFMFKNIYFSFDYNKRYTLVNDKKELEKIENNKYILVGIYGKTYYLMDKNNKFYKMKDGKYEELENIIDFLMIDRNKLPLEFATVKLLKSHIPVVMLLMYIYGFFGLLKKLNVKYKIYNISERPVLKENEYKIVFRDKQIVFEYGVDTKNDLILAGLTGIKNIKEIDVMSLDTKDGIISLMFVEDLNKRYVTEFKMLDSMFIDPVTKDVLELMKEPTIFRLLLIRACELLVTDYAKHPNSIDGVLIKGYDRMSGMVYKTLVDNIKRYENNKGTINNKITFSPYEVIDKINNDSTVMLVEDQNPIAMLKQVEDVTMTGMFGRNKETIIGEAREFHASDVGIFSESVKDNSDVGISAYLSASPTLKNARGLVDVKETSELTPTNMFSTSTMLTPGNDIDDTKRQNFTSIQYGHVIPLVNAFVLPVRTGYESVIAQRVPKKYATKANQDGVITTVDKNKVVVEYKDKTKETFKLYSWTTKEEAHATYTHTMITHLRKGDKVTKGDVITYDKLFFEPDMFDSKNVVMKTGMLALTQFIDAEDTYEDSMSIHERMTNNMKTKVTKVRSIIIDKDTIIKKLVNIGDKVDYHSKLFTMTESIDETEGGFELSQDTLDILSEFTNSSPKAKMDGVVNKIVFYYNAELKDINKGLRKYIEESDARLGKYTGKVTSGYSVQGTPLLDGDIEIKIYIEGDLPMSIGDKAVLANQLKCTVGDVLHTDIETENGDKVDVRFSSASKDARIVNSPDVIGTATTALMTLQESVVKDFFEE